MDSSVPHRRRPRRRERQGLRCRQRASGVGAPPAHLGTLLHPTFTADRAQVRAGSPSASRSPPLTVRCPRVFGTPGSSRPPSRSAPGRHRGGTAGPNRGPTTSTYRWRRPIPQRPVEQCPVIVCPKKGNTSSCTKRIQGGHMIPVRQPGRQNPPTDPSRARHHQGGTYSSPSRSRPRPTATSPPAPVPAVTAPGTRPRRTSTPAPARHSRADRRQAAGVRSVAGGLGGVRRRSSAPA
jgi:hypothetical protein